jgi:hypothetical protein
MAGVSPRPSVGKGSPVSTLIHQHWLLISLLALGCVLCFGLLGWSLCAISQGADYAEQRLLKEQRELEELLRRIA